MCKKSNPFYNVGSTIEFSSLHGRANVRDLFSCRQSLCIVHARSSRAQKRPNLSMTHLRTVGLFETDT